MLLAMAGRRQNDKFNRSKFQDLTHMLRPLSISFLVFVLSCGSGAGKLDNETVKEGHKQTTTSTDTAKLGRLIDLGFYKPSHVKFKYIFHNNSGNDERGITIPGPSDSRLEAILYFEPGMFKQFMQASDTIDAVHLFFNREDFNFDWLDKDVKDELMRGPLKGGHPNVSPYRPYYVHGIKLWPLDNKLLLIKLSD